MAFGCGIFDAQLYVRPYRKGYVRDPADCVGRWNRRRTYPFGLRKVILRALGSLPVSSYVEHEFSPAVARLSIYPTSDASSPYVKWFDRVFTRMAEAGLFNKPQRVEFVDSYRFQVRALLLL